MRVVDVSCLPAVRGVGNSGVYVDRLMLLRLFVVLDSTSGSVRQVLVVLVALVRWSEALLVSAVFSLFLRGCGGRVLVVSLLFLVFVMADVLVSVAS